MRRFALFFLFLFLFLNTALALDFNAAGDSEVAAFRCYTIEKELFVSNPESSDIVVSFSIGGDAVDFIRLSDLSLELGPGETKAFKIFYKVPCDAKEGVYDLDIYFDGSDSQKVLSQKINVFTPDSLFVSVEPTSQNINPCGVASYTIRIENPTNINESYSLKLDDFVGEYDVEDSFELNGYENKTLELKIAPKDCKKSGEFSFNLIASTIKTNLTKKIPLFLNISSFGIPEIAKGVDRIRTDFDEKSASIKIRNLGKKDVNYDVIIDGLSWVAAPKNLFVKAGSEAPLDLLLKPDKSVKEGEYNFEIKLAVPESSVAYSKNFTVVLKPFSLIERKPLLIFVPLVILLLLGLGTVGIIFFVKSKAFEVLKQEVAKKRAERDALLQKKKDKLSKEKRERLERREALKRRKLETENKLLELRKKKKEEKLRKKEEKLKKKEEKRKRKALLKEQKRKERLEKIAAKERARRALKAEITNKIKAQFKLIPKDKIYSGDSKKGFAFGWILFIIIALLLVLFLKSFGLLVLLVFIVVSVWFEFRKAFHFVRRWKFLEKGSALPISTGWKLGVYSFTVVALKNVKRFSLTVRKFSSKLDKLKCFGCFAVSSNVEGAVKLSDVRFRVLRRWFEKHNISPDDFKLLKRAKDGWQRLKIGFIKADKRFFYFSVDKLGVGEFALAGKPLQKIQKKRFNIFWIALIGIVALFLLQPSFSTDGIPTQVWQKDTLHSISLGRYFHDPDLDSLKFSADETENIDISFDGDVALLNPSPGWTGVEYTRFHATDPAGETASSNNVKLVVKDSLPFDGNLRWVNLIALALLLFLVVLVLFEKKI